MNKLDPHTLEPFWESWYIDSLIGEGSFGYVYKIYKEEFGQKYYSALKIISLPKTEAEEKEIMYEYSSEDSVTQYFHDVAEEIYKEIQIMEELKGKTNIVSFEDHKIVKKQDGPGYYVLIRMELLTCLNDYLAQHDLTTKMLYQLALDLGKALQLCQKRNIIHRDIKPANIFISSDGDFKLGDFGIARQLEGVESGLSIKGTYSYMAPEVYLGNHYDARADIYSLGMVLYYYLNRKHIPFTDVSRTIQRFTEKQDAMRRRFQGEEFPDPVQGSKEFIEVIKKASAFAPENRYQNADEFLDALVSMNEFEDEVLFSSSSDSQKAADTTTGTSKPAEVKPEKAKPEEDATVIEDSDPTVIEPMDDDDDKTVILTPPKPIEPVKQEEIFPSNEIVPEKKKHPLRVAGIVGIAGIVLAAGVFLIVKQVTKGDNTVPAAEVTVMPTVTPTATPLPTSTPTPVPTMTPTPEPTVEPENIADEVVEVNNSNKGMADCTSIDHLDQVTILTMNHNTLTAVSELSAAVKLTYLDIEANQITSLKGLEALSKLEFLNAGSNQLTQIDEVAELSSLNTLILSNNSITDLQSLSKLTQLRELRLDANSELTDIGVLKACQELQVLDISNTKVSDITCLYELKKLSVLNIQFTKVDKQQVEKLKKALPDCTIIQ